MSLSGTYFSVRFTDDLELTLGGLRAILTDQNKLVVAVGGVTALAAGVYTTRYQNICFWNEEDSSNGTFFSLIILLNELIIPQ